MRHSPADRTTGGGRPARPAGAHAGARVHRSPHLLRRASGAPPMRHRGERECHRRRHMQGRRRPAEAGGRKTPKGVWRARNAAWHGRGWSRPERSSTIAGSRRATSRAVPVFCFGESPTPIGSDAVPLSPLGVRPRGASRCTESGERMAKMAPHGGSAAVAFRLRPSHIVGSPRSAHATPPPVFASAESAPEPPCPNAAGRPANM